MNAWRLTLKEMWLRKWAFLLGVLSVAVAIGCAVGAVALLRVHGLATKQILERKSREVETRVAALNDDVRKSMLKLGFNVVILPKDQNLSDWYADDYASKYMPEDYVERLAGSGIVTVRHFLPSLQQKVEWSEAGRVVILMGIRGEVQNPSKGPRKPLVQPVPAGGIVLGYRLHQAMGLNVGDTTSLLGRTFTVHRCHEERGNKDDITAWIPLAEAQELLGKTGLINAILAVECVCARPDAARIRAEIARVLPHTQVIERGPRVLARAEARMRVAEEGRASIERERQSRAALRRHRERLAALLVPLAMVASALWIGVLALGNVRERRSEIGILRALGVRAGQILGLFLMKALIMGLAGGVLGVGAGWLAGRRLGVALETTVAETGATPGFDPWLAIIAVLAAPLLACVACWIPALIAMQQDPAVILQEE